MTKILIVEDEEAISNLIRMSLCKTGYICEQAFDGETAADLIAENSYDLILLDIMLPGIDGYQDDTNAGHFYYGDGHVR